MRLLFLIFYLSVRTLAGPQQPLPPGDPPPLPNPGTLVAPIPPAATILTANDAPHPAVTGGSDSSGGAGGAGAPFCECGYTYCSAVLMGMSESLVPFLRRIGELDSARSRLTMGCQANRGRRVIWWTRIVGRRTPPARPMHLIQMYCRLYTFAFAAIQLPRRAMS